MTVVFYIAAVVAVLATVTVIVETNAMHALLNLVVSLLAVAIIFYVLGAPFAAALEVIVYAGAIMVLFLFVVMMLNLGEYAAEQERRWLTPRIWIGPAVLSAVATGRTRLHALAGRRRCTGERHRRQSSASRDALFFGPYLLAVELASMLLLAGLVGAYHLGRRERRAAEGEIEEAGKEPEGRMAEQ